MALRVVFMGTPDYGVPSLEALISAGYDVVGVFMKNWEEKDENGTCTAAEQVLGIGLHRQIRAAGGKAIGHLRHRNDGHLFRHYNGVADDRLHVHHFPHLFHCDSHEILDRFLFLHFLTSLILLSY